jgi:hypothetical protein
VLLVATGYQICNSPDTPHLGCNIGRENSRFFLSLESPTSRSGDATYQECNFMLNLRRLTTGAAVLVTLGVTATPITALSPTNLESLSGGYIAQNRQSQDSQVPDSVKQRNISTSGISGRSISSTLPGAIQRNPDGTTPPIKPLISPASTPFSILDRAGRKVTRIQPNKEGYFRVILKPGTYSIAPEFKDSHYTVLRNSNALRAVTVRAGTFTPLQIEYTVLAP